MSQRLLAWIVPLPDLSLVPSNLVWKLVTTCEFRFREFNSFCHLCELLLQPILAYTVPTHIFTHITIKIGIISLNFIFPYGFSLFLPSFPPSLLFFLTHFFLLFHPFASQSVLELKILLTQSPKQRNHRLSFI